MGHPILRGGHNAHGGQPLGGVLDHFLGHGFHQGQLQVHGVPRPDMVGNAVYVILSRQAPQAHHRDTLGGHQGGVARHGHGQGGGAVVRLVHRRPDPPLCVGQVVRLAGLFQDPCASPHSGLDLLLGDRVRVGVLPAGVGPGQGLFPAPALYIGFPYGQHRVLFLVRLPVKYHDFLGVHLHGVAVSVAQLHVKIAVGLPGLFNGLDRERGSLHIPGQGNARPACNLFSDFLGGYLFPGLCPLGFPKSAVRRHRHSGNGPGNGPPCKLEIVQDEKPAGEGAAVALPLPVGELYGGLQRIACQRQPCHRPLAVPVMDRNIQAVRLSAGRVRVGDLRGLAQHFTFDCRAVPGQIHRRAACSHAPVLQIGRFSALSSSGGSGV